MSRLHRPKAGFWIRLCVVVIYPVVGLVYRVRWRNLDRIPAPETGGAIIAINHVSNTDTTLMARLVWQAGRIPRFLTKSGVFDIPVAGKILLSAGQIPVHRGTGDSGRALQAVADALDAGEAVIIYPEGTITKDPDQWPMQAKSGIARLVLLTPHTPVVPVGQWGAQERRGRQPWWRRLRRHRAGASVGEPLDLSRYAGREPDADTLREISDLIMTEIRARVAELREQDAPVHVFTSAHKLVDRARRHHAS